MSKIDHDYTDEPVCPYCGYQMRDAWDLGQGEDFEHECGQCELTYGITRHVSINYSTKPVTQETQEQ